LGGKFTSIARLKERGQNVITEEGAEQTWQWRQTGEEGEAGMTSRRAFPQARTTGDLEKGMKLRLGVGQMKSGGSTREGWREWGKGSGGRERGETRVGMEWRRGGTRRRRRRVEELKKIGGGGSE